MATTTSSISPDQHRARLCLQRGLHHLDVGDLQAARDDLLQAIRHDDSLATAYYHLGNCLRRRHDAAGAERALLAAIERDAGLGDAYTSLAYLYHETGRDGDATQIIRQRLTVHSDNVELRFQLGGLLAKFNLCGEAEILFQSCPKSDPRHAQAWLTLGNAYQSLGQFDRAEQAFLSAIEANGNTDAAYLRLAHTRRFGPQDAALMRKFEDTLKRTDLTPSTRICLHFSLGKMHDDLGAYDEAFAHFRRGNELQHQQVQYDRQGLIEYITRAKKVFTPDLMRRAAAAADDRTPRPIFVVGMLRSGTTLVERILASHPRCYGLGETELVDSVTQDFAARSEQAYPECVSRLMPPLTQTLATALRGAWPESARNFAWVVDKNPLNFLHLGFIAMLYPGAAILHCVRDPLDTCLSIYFQHFAHPRNTYAYDFGDIAFFYRQYRDFMEYWRGCLPIPMHEIRYQELVQNPEAETRKLVTAAGLEWDPACLEFHKHTARIETTSVWQARQPIYRDSAGRWRHYARHLQSLKQMLAEQ